MPSNTTIKLVKRLFFLYTALFSHNLFAEHALPEFDANYAIQAFGIKVAKAQYKLSYTETGYQFTQKTSLYGVAKLFRTDAVDIVSYIDEVGDKLLLQKHRYRQTGEEKNRDEDFSIHWNTSEGALKNPLKGKITGIVRSKEINIETDTAVWEVLSFQIPLMIEANKDTKEYPYKAVLKGEIDTYKFVLTSIKSIDFAGKKYQALQVVRTDPRRDRQLKIWLLSELNNIPVLIEEYRDGKIRSRMQLESVKFNDEKPISDQSKDNDDF